MASTLKIPVQVTIRAVVHEVQGGGFWAEVASLPGCVAQAENLATLERNLRQAIEDWWAESPEKTETESLQLTAIQGGDGPPADSYPLAYPYLPPPSWVEDGDE